MLVVPSERPTRLAGDNRSSGKHPRVGRSASSVRTAQLQTPARRPQPSACASRDSQLLVEVADDGVGGADASRGSGIRGLADRIEALDGRLDVNSPPGAGTRVSAAIPL